MFNPFNGARRNLTGYLTAIGQLPFPAAQLASSDANTLDDYEEGTFTPTFTCSTTPPSDVTYGAQSGKYTKIGNVVHFYAAVTLTSKGTGGVGRIEIDGLPFTVGSVSPVASSFWTLYTFSTASLRSLVGLIFTGTTKVSFYEAGDNTGTTASAFANVANTSTLSCSGTYFV